ncbi:MAG: SelB C-terminal domain-containing protein [Candidatus Tenebribacter burtonii]|jgi:phage FluMu protein gp41|nr:SelB C-terminal domain-containing protein [Candidatus Tenebribacter burtonii]
MSDLIRFGVSIDKELLKKQISCFIKSNGSIHVKKIAKLTNTSRRTLSLIADYLNRVKFTKRVRYELI